MSEKELVATWDNEHGVDWKTLRGMLNKQLRNKTGYLTVKVTHDGAQAQLFFEEVSEPGKPFTFDDLQPETKDLIRSIRAKETGNRD